MTFWHLWDAHGLNWLLFLAAFCAIEGAALLTHHRTLSAAFWAASDAPGAWGVVLALGFQALALILFAHLVGGWGR